MSPKVERAFEHCVGTSRLRREGKRLVASMSPVAVGEGDTGARKRAGLSRRLFKYLIRVTVDSSSSST